MQQRNLRHRKVAVCKTSPTNMSVDALIFPTPTSLPFKSPMTKEMTSVSLSSVTAHLEALPHSLPLIIGQVERKTKNVSTLRRALKRRKIGDGLDNDDLTLANGTGSMVNSFGQKVHLLPSSLPTLRCKNGLELIFDSRIGKTPLMKKLVSHISMDHLFQGTKCSKGTRLELELSIASILYPPCKSFKTSLDTCFLAYGIICEYSKTINPVRVTARNQLYIAALLIAFKYNEEEDVEIVNVSKTIHTSGHAPLSFKRPLPADVVKMEQKVMKAIDWNLTTIITPMVYVCAFMDCLFDTTIEWKRQVIANVEVLIKSLLLEPTATRIEISTCKNFHYLMSFFIALALIRTCNNAIKKTKECNLATLSAQIYEFITGSKCDKSSFVEYSNHLNKEVVH